MSLASYAGFPLATRLAQMAVGASALVVILAFLATVGPQGSQSPFRRAVTRGWAFVEPVLPQSVRHEIVRPGGWAEVLQRGLRVVQRGLFGVPRVARPAAQAPGHATRTAVQKEAYGRLHVEKFLAKQEMARLPAAEIRRRIGARSMSHDPRWVSAKELKN